MPHSVAPSAGEKKSVTLPMVSRISTVRSRSVSLKRPHDKTYSPSASDLYPSRYIVPSIICSLSLFPTRATSIQPPSQRAWKAGRSGSGCSQ
jgi:hypothetical protein